jgi:hypothetical protein
MVFRKAYDTVNRAGRAWDNFNQGTYNTLSRPDSGERSAAILLAEVIADGVGADCQVDGVPK